jgi:hypothetical protein
MPLVFECACGKKMKVRDELAGKKVKCPGCGKAVMAPEPEPMVVEPVGEEMMAGEPPIVAASSTAVQVGEAPPGSEGVAPTWETKKKSDQSTKKRDEEEDDAEKPVPHWVFGGTFSSEVMALGNEGIWFASFKGDELKKVTRLLKNGAPPANVLGKKAYYIPWQTISSIYCNRKLKGFTIAHSNQGELASKVLTPADHAERDEIFKAIEKFMRPDWSRKTVKHTPMSAMALPILSLVITGVITIGVAILSIFIGGDWEGRGRGAAVAALLNLLNWMGPIGTCGVGVLIGACMMLWMLVRILNPPIEVTLAPAPPDQRRDDED